MFLRPELTFPPAPGYTEPSVWTPEGFLVGGNLFPVLSYDATPSGWSDELTVVHEELAGDDHYIDRASRKHAAEELRRWLNGAGNRIMDIGCSSGFFLRLLCDTFPADIIVGADCVRGPLDRLAKNIPGIPLVHFDLMRCPLEEDSFDAVVLLNVLEHIEDDLGAMRQAFRILRPGGLAVIEVPANPTLYDVYDRELRHFRRYRMADLLTGLRRAGFEILDKSHLGFFLFPGFWMVKKRNQTYLRASPEAGREVVKRNMSGYRGSGFMHSILRVEANLRKIVRYPFGIRCLVTCRKPLI